MIAWKMPVISFHRCFVNVIFYLTSDSVATRFLPACFAK